jgi:hypothetical protein
MMFVPHWKLKPPRSVTGTALLSYTDDVRTSLETQASAVCYGDSFSVLYADDARTPLETHLFTSNACYGDSFTFYCAFRETEG